MRDAGDAYIKLGDAISHLAGVLYADATTFGEPLSIAEAGQVAHVVTKAIRNLTDARKRIERTM